VITLHLVRHADAADIGPLHPDDASRPLTPKGVAQARLLARALRRAGTGIDLLCASPRRRALQTAELIAPDGPPPTPLDALATGSADDTARALAAAVSGAAVSGAAAAGSGAARPARERTVVVAVGHEPRLSELTSYLLTGRRDALAIAFRKASVATLQGRLAPGGMTLVAFAPMHVTRALLSDDSDDASG
jgi:phosphohistidine phosphatase